MEVITVIGQTYALRSMSGGNLKNEAGDVLETLEPGVQLHVTAQEPAWVLPDDCQVTACRTFKNAALALRLLGGGESSVLPAGFTMVEWLEVTSGTQGIFTPYVDVDGCDLEVKGLFKNGQFFGKAVKHFNEAIQNFSFAYRDCYMSESYVNVRLPRLSQAVLSESPLNKNITFKYTASDGTIYINDEDVTKSRLGATTPDDDHPIAILGCTKGYPMNGEPIYVGSPVGMRQSYVKLTNPNGTLKAHYVAALDETGTPCMYDLVSKQPFYNSGTGDFLYPGKETQATTYSLRRPRMCAQMTPHGIRRLYHVPKGYNGTPEEYAAENGFKVLVETPAPVEGYWAPQWHEREDCIELEWVETVPPAEEELSTIE